MKSVKPKTRVLVLGETGAGKSSIVKGMGALSKQNTLPQVGDGARGQTGSCELFENTTTIFVDTCGLGETQSGNVPVDEAMLKLAEFFRGNSQGFNLALFVVNDVKITTSKTLAFEVFQSLLGGKGVPFALVCTKSDNNVGEKMTEDVLEEWRKDS